MVQMLQYQVVIPKVTLYGMKNQEQEVLWVGSVWCQVLQEHGDPLA